MAEAIAPLFDWTPPEPTAPALRDAGALSRLRCAAAATGGRRRTWRTCSRPRPASTWPRLRVGPRQGALGWHAINDSPPARDPGHRLVLLHDHAAEGRRRLRSWGFVRGGMGQVTQAMAEAAREAGAEIRSGAEVERIVVDQRRRRRRGLADGSACAPCVCRTPTPSAPSSGWSSRETLPGRVPGGDQAYRCEGGASRSTSRWRSSRAARRPRPLRRALHRGLMEFTRAARPSTATRSAPAHGVPAHRPHIELCMPTVHDPSLAPEGQRV